MNSYCPTHALHDGSVNVAVIHGRLVHWVTGGKFAASAPIAKSVAGGRRLVLHVFACVFCPTFAKPSRDLRWNFFRVFVVALRLEAVDRNQGRMR
jgi:hypothetical protein